MQKHLPRPIGPIDLRSHIVCKDYAVRTFTPTEECCFTNSSVETSTSAEEENTQYAGMVSSGSQITNWSLLQVSDRWQDTFWNY